LGSPTASSAIAMAAPAAVESSPAIIADSALHYSTTTTGDFIEARQHLLMVVALMVTAAIVIVGENLPSRQLSLPYCATNLLPPWYLAFAEAKRSEAVQELPWLKCCCPDVASAAGRRPNLLSAFD
jgi:hypothetical protein